jgi:hypothetical protein
MRTRRRADRAALLLVVGFEVALRLQALREQHLGGRTSRPPSL